MDEAWVNLRLVDANDNAPTFASNHAHLTLSEDTPAGTLLASFTARDEDGVSVTQVCRVCGTRQQQSLLVSVQPDWR